jgi:hypothetical protein
METNKKDYLQAFLTNTIGRFLDHINRHVIKIHLSLSLSRRSQSSDAPENAFHYAPPFGVQIFILIQDWMENIKT